MSHALFAGTFDPPTLGHLDIFKRAAALCDKLTIGVAQVSSKTPLFSLEERVEMVQSLTDAHVVPMPALAVDLAKEIGADYLIRAVRTCGDFEAEHRMALANLHLAQIETLFLVSRGEFAHISSTLIREIARSHGDLSTFVPANISRKLSTQ